MKINLDKPLDIRYTIYKIKNSNFQKGDSMAYRTEHAGAKKGKGAWDKKAVAKKTSKKLRRANDKNIVRWN